MAELKTKLTNMSVTDFLDRVEPEEKRQDSYALSEMMREITGEEPKMWGTSIVGFGQYHYKSERSRQEGEWPITGFSPRKQALTLYLMPGFGDLQEMLSKLGKHKTSVGCLFIKKLADVDSQILRELVRTSVKKMKVMYPDVSGPQ